MSAMHRWTMDATHHWNEETRMKLSDDDDPFFTFVFVTPDHDQQLLTLS